VWLERVDASGSIGFVMEDGEVVHEPKAEAEAPAGELVGAA
jgi:hypothetical protein